MEKYSFITQEELRSLLYYQGAVEKIQLNSSELELRKFYSINNAYETINMLLSQALRTKRADYGLKNEGLMNKFWTTWMNF